MSFYKTPNDFINKLSPIFFFQQSLHICFASEATYFPSITIHLSSNVFHWRLKTKLVHEYVEYGINNQGNADAGNTEY